MNAARGLAYFLNDDSGKKDGNGSGSGKDEAIRRTPSGGNSHSRSRSRSPRSAESSAGHHRSSSPSNNRQRNRSGERHSRDKDGGGYDVLDDSVTKSNDPKLILSRVFIGNLPSDKTNKEELFNQYKRFGKILGLSIHKGFGFVQFAEEHSAIKAVENLDKTTFKGNLLDLRISSKGRKQPIPNFPLVGSTSMPPMKRPYDDDRMLPPRYDQYRLERGQPPPHFPGDMSPMVRDDPYLMSGGGRYPPGVVAANQFAPPRAVSMPHNPEMYRDDRDMAYSVVSTPQQLPTPLSSASSTAEPYSGLSKKVEYGVERPFDAVIVVTQQNLKLYAEMVERRLLELNMVVDMIFLLNDKALNKAIDDMTCRGVLYIIVVQPQNEEHKSITVNIMHGTPQEHRNMPLEDALVLLARNFNAYLSSLRCGSEQPTMGFLLNLLADGKHLSVAELDRIIAHLQDRRDRLIEAEGGRKEPVAAGLNAAGTTALQQKILGILSGSLLSGGNNQSGMSGGAITSTNQNQGGGGASQSPAGGGPATVLTNLAQQFGISMNQPTAAAANQQQPTKFDQPMDTGGPPKPTGIGGLTFTDPNVKKTIDSLLQNPNLLKSLQAGGNLGQKMTPTSTIGGPQQQPAGPPTGVQGGHMMPPQQPPTSMAPFAGGPLMPPPQAAFPGGGKFRF